MDDAKPDITARAIKMSAQHEQPSTDGDERFEVASVLRELVAEVERLRSENARLDGVTKGLAGSHASLRAEVERMRPVVSAAEAWHDSNGTAVVPAVEELLDAVQSYRAWDGAP